MALRGVWQLQKLIVSYCNWGGSSRGIRCFTQWMPVLAPRKTLGRSRRVKLFFWSTEPIVEQSSWNTSEVYRAFMETELPALQERNPQLEIVPELIRGQHPHLKAFYKNKNQRVVCVKNMTPDDILLHATRLRNALGRKVVKLKTRHITKHPSVQGTWSTALKF